jgi:rhodanese-related sulfurtransferase
MRYNTIILLRISCLTFQSTSAHMGGVVSSSSSDDQVLAALQVPNRLVLDCRSTGEFKSGDAFQGAKNIPVDSIESRYAEVGEKDRTIITYCAAGVRAGRAADILRSHGYTQVFSTTNADHLRDCARRIPK